MIKNIVARYKRYRAITPTFSEFIESKPILFFLSVFSWPSRMIKGLYRWMVGWAGTKYGEQALAGISFAESSFFPIPPDPLLIAMVIIHPMKFLRFAIICTVASVSGGIFGYIIGVGLFETVGLWIMETYHLQEEFALIGEKYAENAFLTIFTAGFTPIPFKLITIAAGVFSVNFPVFVLAAFVGRGARFFLVAYLMHHLGKRYKDVIEKYVDLFSLAFVVLLVLGFFAVKYVL